MKKFVKRGFKFNLQLFSGGIEVPDELIPDELKEDYDGQQETSENLRQLQEPESEGFEDDGNESYEDSELDSRDEEESDEELLEEEHTVPLHVLTNQRKKLKGKINDLEEYEEIVNKLGKLSGMSVEQMKQNILNNEIKSLIDNGMTQAQAFSHIDNRNKERSKARLDQDKRIQSEIQALNSNPQYSNARLYQDEIAELMEEKNINAEDAYMLTYGKKVMKEGTYAKKANKREVNTVQRDGRSTKVIKKQTNKRNKNIEDMVEILNKEGIDTDYDTISLGQAKTLEDYAKASGRMDELHSFTNTKKSRRNRK